MPKAVRRILALWTERMFFFISFTIQKNNSNFAKSAMKYSFLYYYHIITEALLSPLSTHFGPLISIGISIFLGLKCKCYPDPFLYDILS